jgi:outer membrane protein, heavy metal efflux system
LSGDFLVKYMLCLCLALVSWCHLANANEVESPHTDTLVVNPQLDLHQVLEKTYARHPQQYSLQSREATVNARDVMARSLLPAAPAMSISHQNDTLGGARGERDWQAEVELPVWLPSQRTNRQKVAEATRSDLASSRDSLKLQVAGLLREAVWDIAMNENLLQLAQQRVDSALALQHDVERRFQAGEVAKTDLMLAQQERLIAEKGKLLAEAELMHARHRYLLLTGSHEIPAKYDESLSNVEDFTQSPIWLESESKIQLTKQERDLIQVERRENPQVLLNTRTQRGPFDNAYNESVGLKVRIPLDSEVRNAPLQAAAEVAVGNAMTERENLRLALEAALHEAEHNLSVSRAELGIVTQQYDIAKESLRLARKAFQLGETDLVSLLRVQAQTQEIERAFTTRQIQVQWNIVRYNQAVGVLP